ncbi:MAG: glycerol-3-phosphate dehydrogenase/oxidase [Leptospiraceae bacterium]|nr:glycerol-3-phosphate dehydrogenase/oxidase [Leptospiraceae bacterium]
MKLRENNLAKLQSETFDVAIIGGGINGAVSASALSSMGARVALVDAADFASSTSQESSNLVWGGIKYLETMELGLVSKLCKARNHLLKSYPANIREIRFFVNLDKGFRFGRFFLYLGALFYWLIGKFYTKAPRILSRSQIKAEEGAVSIDQSQGGFEYSDAYLIDNDARFVFHFIRAAIDHGAIVANYVKVTGATFTNGEWRITARDQMQPQSDAQALGIRARILINASGPWADAVNQITSIETRHHHLFSKGVHLIVNRVTPDKRVLTFFADDGRLFFVIPMGNKSCIGTTDTRVENLPARVEPADRQFILDNINKRLDLAVPLRLEDIIAERCGVRPLVVSAQAGKGRKKDTGDWTALSRKHAIETQLERNHISIFGGKLTDCLNVGEEVADAVARMGLDLPWRRIRWYGEAPAEVRNEFFHQARLMELDQLTAAESSEVISKRLWRRYGPSALELLEDIRTDPEMGEVLIKGTEYLRCELYHAARREMVTCLADFLRRRSKIALIERTATIASAPGLKEACHILFGDLAEQKLKEYFDNH